MSRHAYCPYCDADVIPTRNNACGFCERDVDPHRPVSLNQHSVARAALAASLLSSETRIGMEIPA